MTLWVVHLTETDGEATATAFFDMEEARKFIEEEGLQEDHIVIEGEMLGKIC